MRIFFAGGGRCNEYISKRLIREGHDLVILEQNEERCHYLLDVLDARIVNGNCTSIDDWRRAGLEQADRFIACTNSDEINIVACLIANNLAPQAKKAIRLRTPEFDQWQPTFEKLGLQIDRVVHPESDMAARILRVISMPGIADIRNFADGLVSLFSMNIEPSSPLAGIKALDIGQVVGPGNALVGIVFRANDVIIPTESDRLQAGDHVYIMTSDEQLAQTLQRLGIHYRSQLRQVFIVGGGEVGLELARSLEQEKVSIKLFDEDPKRCEYLASELPHTVVINTDGTNQDTLIEENIQGIDAFISLTGQEDANLIACLLARRMGVDKVVPLVDRINYQQLAQRLGINTTVNPRIKAADAIFEFVRKGRVLSVRTLGEETVEAIEFVVAGTSPYINCTLDEIDLPDGSLLGAIVRQDVGVLIADAATCLQSGDRVVVFVRENAVQKLESKFLASLAPSG